jgi:hypothetical protein
MYKLQPLLDALFLGRILRRLESRVMAEARGDHLAPRPPSPKIVTRIETVRSHNVDTGLVWHTVDRPTHTGWSGALKNGPLRLYLQHGVNCSPHRLSISGIGCSVSGRDVAGRDHQVGLGKTKTLLRDAESFPWTHTRCLEGPWL